MQSVPLSGHRVPVITKKESQTPHNFAEKNMGLEGSMGQSSEKQFEGDDVRKSSLVEISTPTSRLLYKTNAIFPFDLIPDTLVIDEIKITVISRKLLTRTINSVLIKDITDISISNNPFFGALTISGGDYQGLESTVRGEKGALMIKFLHINEALRARRIIMGLMIYSDQKIDTSKMKIEEVLTETEKLGKARTGQ
jgi:hypothetical protein